MCLLCGGKALFIMSDGTVARSLGGVNRMKFTRTLLLAALATLAVLTGCGGGGAANHIIQPPPPVSSPISMEVVLFPGQQDGPDSAAIQQYLINNTQVALGATLVVQWSAVDRDGIPGDYDWSYPDNQILPWKNAGKKVNLVIWANSDGSDPICGIPGQSGPGQFGTDGTGNCAIPTYVWKELTTTDYVTCNPGNANASQQMPNYFNSAFQAHYKTFIQQLIQHYGSDSSIGYIRIGLGRGGETIPEGDWENTSEACGMSYVNAWGYSVSSWDSNYLQMMLQYEGSLHSPKQLMVGVTPMGNANRNADFAAQVAAPLGIGIGSQGWQQSDLSNPPASCAADWCNLFTLYPTAPHELQTYGPSCPPTDSGCTGAQAATGSLVSLFPFAVANHATIIELYLKDWLTAFDPNFPGYTGTYATAIENAALGK